MAFRIARPVFTLAVRLIDRLAVDAGTGGARVLVVRVDVIDLDDQAGICHVDAARRVEMMLGGDAMQPDGNITRTHLTMNRLPVGCSMHTSRREPNARTRKSCAAAMS